MWWLLVRAPDTLTGGCERGPADARAHQCTADGVRNIAPLPASGHILAFQFIPFSFFFVLYYDFALTTN
jgi:hypothetical protein